MKLIPKKSSVKLIPPTGLLGTFFSGARGREVRFREIRNVELRHVVELFSEMRQDNTHDKMMTEELTTRHAWEIHLTLADETILLAMTTHSAKQDRENQPMESTSKIDVASKFHTNVTYYQQLQQQQQEHDKAEHSAEATAYLVAAVIDCTLVKTQIGAELGEL